jgi:seryl-tRNA synthetase
MKPLYELTDKFLQLADKLSECDQITDEQLSEINASEDDLKAKICNVAAFIKNLELEVDATTKVIGELTERLTKATNKMESLKAYLAFQMDKAQIKEVKSDMFNVKLKTNPPKVKIFKEKVTTTVNKKLIKQDLQDGVVLDWAVLENERKVQIK